MKGSKTIQHAALLTVVSVCGMLRGVGVLGADDVDVVRAGNKSALESIRSFSCRVTLQSPVSQIPGAEMSTADYWQSGESWRIRSVAGSQIADSIRHDFMRKSLKTSAGRDGSKRTVFTIDRVDIERPSSRLDPTGHGLLRLFGPKIRRLTLEELLDEGFMLREVSHEKYLDHDCIVLAFSMKADDGGKAEFTLWFDPAVNYLARKLTGNFSSRSANSPKVRRESEVVRFKEPSPGIFFPEQAETKFYNDDKVVQHDIVTFSDIRVNQPLPAKIFELAIPPNSTVIDKVQGKEYAVDSAGKVVGTERPVSTIPPIPAGTHQTPTSEEPTSVIRWLLYALILLFAVSAGIWYVRRLRASAAT